MQHDDIIIRKKTIYDGMGWYKVSIKTQCEDYPEVPVLCFTAMVEDKPKVNSHLFFDEFIQYKMLKELAMIQPELYFIRMQQKQKDITGYLRRGIHSALVSNLIACAGDRKAYGEGLVERIDAWLDESVEKTYQSLRDI